MACLYNHKHQEIKSLCGKDRLFSPLGCVEGNIQLEELRWGRINKQVLNSSVWNLFLWCSLIYIGLKIKIANIISTSLFVISCLSLCAHILKKEFRGPNFVETSWLISSYFIIGCFFPKRKNILIIQISIAL